MSEDRVYTLGDVHFSGYLSMSFADFSGKLQTILWENNNQPNDQIPLKNLSVGEFLIVDVDYKTNK